MAKKDTKIALTPANENIWYGLVTLAGEPTSLGDPLVARNRRYWHYFIYDKISENLKKELGLGDSSTYQRMKKEIKELLVQKGFNESIENIGCKANFSNTSFDQKLFLTGFVFPEDVDFSKARIENYANFIGTKFLAGAKFDLSIFNKPANFENALFTGFTSFSNSIFVTTSNFCSCEFKSTTRFTGTVFKTLPPKFFDANISENISWERVVLPSVPTEQYSCLMHKNTYESLVLMMSKLEKTYDQHMFWRHEMRVRRRLEKYWPAKFMNKVYDIFCEYGYGFGRALAFWFIHILVFAGVLFIPAPHNWAGAVNALATSFANAHSFLGLNRGPLEEVYSEYGKWEYFNIVWTFQALLGIILLFFLLLTIRNRFKMG